MTPLERRASTSLAGIFALRMLGLFLFMPVISEHARTLPDGSPQMVGLAIASYAVAQALLYIPYGWVSDRLGRKPVIVFGLLVFALGSLVGALAHSMLWIVIARLIQGMGAISSAVTALIADLTSEENRTKAMAMVGGSIAITFALSLVVAPPLYSWIGMGGMFTLFGVSALAAIPVVLWVVPAPPPPSTVRAPFAEVLRNGELLRLNFGVYVLHAAQATFFIVVPGLMVAAGLAVAQHWRVYLFVIGASFLVMIPAVIVAETRGKMKAVMLVAIGCILAAQAALAEAPPSLIWIGGLLVVYFIGFNVLEATQPSMVSKLAPGTRKGAAMGVYNTMQSLGQATGGAVGGWLLGHSGAGAVFLFCSALVLVWLIVAAGMAPPPARVRPQADAAAS